MVSTDTPRLAGHLAHRGAGPPRSESRRPPVSTIRRAGLLGLRGPQRRLVATGAGGAHRVMVDPPPIHCKGVQVNGVVHLPTVLIAGPERAGPVEWPGAHTTDRASSRRARAEVRHQRHVQGVPPGDRARIPGGVPRGAARARQARVRPHPDVRLQGRPALGLHLRRLRATAHRARRCGRADRGGDGGDRAPALPAARAADPDDDPPAGEGGRAWRAAGGAVGLGVADLRAVRLRPGVQPCGDQGRQRAPGFPARHRRHGFGRRGHPRAVHGGGQARCTTRWWPSTPGRSCATR